MHPLEDNKMKTSLMRLLALTCSLKEMNTNNNGNFFLYISYFNILSVTISEQEFKFVKFFQTRLRG